MSREIFVTRYFVGDIMSRDIFAAILWRDTKHMTIWNFSNDFW